MQPRLPRRDRPGKREALLLRHPVGAGDSEAEHNRAELSAHLAPHVESRSAKRLNGEDQRCRKQGHGDAENRGAEVGTKIPLRRRRGARGRCLVDLPQSRTWLFASTQQSTAAAARQLTLLGFIL